MGIVIRRFRCVLRLACFALLSAAAIRAPGPLTAAHAARAPHAGAVPLVGWSPKAVVFSSPGGHTYCRIRMGAYLSTSIRLSRAVRHGTLELTIGNEFDGGIVSVAGGPIRRAYGNTAVRNVALSTIPAQTTLRVVYYLVAPERVPVGTYSGTLTLLGSGPSGEHTIGASYAISIELFSYTSGRQPSITAVQ